MAYPIAAPNAYMSAKASIALSLRKALSDNVEALVSGALEAGTDEERVYNSQISLAVRYVFPYTPKEKPAPAEPEPGRYPVAPIDEK